MAQYGNCDIEHPPTPLPNFNRLAFDENNDTSNRCLELALAPEIGAELFAKRTKACELLNRKMKQTTQHGAADPALIHEEQLAWADYNTTKWKHLDDPAMVHFTEAVHRGELDISPYEVSGRKLAHPFPGFSAAMDALWPGYDESYRDFLRKHGAAHVFPERIASLGAVFVPYPDATVEENMELLEHLRHSHKHFRSVPIVYTHTTRRDLVKILSHFDKDMPAAVIDKGGSLLGFVWRRSESEDKVHESQRVGDFYQSIGAASANGIEAPSSTITPEEAYLLLREKNKDFLYRTDDRGIIQVMTKTTSALSTLLPPFTFQEGLGSIVYVGVSDPDETLRQIREYNAFGVAGVIIETAHADRNDVLKLLRRVRKEFPDLFLIVGTVTDPKAVREYLEFADCVKVGIAEGGHCLTSTCGEGIPNAWAGMTCGPAAEGKGTIIVDGWGSTREYSIGMSLHNVRGRQSGGAFAARAESSMPVVLYDGVRGKMCRGEASAAADRARTKRRNGISIKREMADEILPYWEGAELFNPLRDPLTIGEYMWLCKQRLQSLMSYQGVRNKKVDPRRSALRQLHESSRVYIVPPVVAA